MPTYPLYGTRVLRKGIVSRAQIQESLSRDQENRLDGFILTEIGSPNKRSLRATPTQSFLLGALLTGDEQERKTVNPLLSSDVLV